MLLAEENLTPKKGLSPGHVVVSEESQSRADTEATREEFMMSCLSCCGVVFFQFRLGPSDLAHLQRQKLDLPSYHSL